MSAIPSPLVMLHLGLGAFHRAHQAVYLHELIASGDARWCLAGGNIRPDMAETIAALVAQANAALLAVRIRVENEALSARPGPADRPVGAPTDA